MDFGFENPNGSSGGAPSAHAASHKAGGSDALLASPGAIGGGTASTVRGTTITATTGFVGDGSQLTNLPAGGGAAKLLARAGFATGGSIAQWNIFGTLFGGATYSPNNSSNVLGAALLPLLHSPDGGDYTIRAEYDADDDVVVTPRIRHSNGTETDASPVTLLAANADQEFSVTLAAGDTLGLHFAPANTVVTYNYLYLFL